MGISSRAESELWQVQSLFLLKTPSIADSVWRALLMQGGQVRSLWLSSNHLQTGTLVETATSRVLRDYMFSVLRGKMDTRYCLIDPPLPMPELVRDEFNAYKKSTLQEYLYELLFKEAGTATTTSISTSAAGCTSLGDLPSFEDNYETDLPIRLQKLEASALQLIVDVYSHSTI